MKKFSVVCLFFLIFIFFNNTFAQTLGIKAGLNLSTMLSKDDEGTYSDKFKLNPGYQFGLTSGYSISKLFELELGLLFSTKGYITKVNYPIPHELNGEKAILNLYYLSMPLTAKYFFYIREVKIYCELGTYFDLGLKGTHEIITDIDGYPGNLIFDVKWGKSRDDEFIRPDFGLVLGSGVDFKAFQLACSYNLGLSNIASNTKYGGIDKNRVICITLGYKII